MRSEQYTAEAICRSMGLDAFESTSNARMLRVLFKPSFHPEVCITFTETLDTSSTKLSVTVLTEMFWRQETPRRLPELNEEVEVRGTGLFDEITAGFVIAFAERDRNLRRVCLDGMRVECCRNAENGIERFADHVNDPAVSTFVDHLVWWAWIACRTPGIRNALADCAWYLGKDYPRDSDPEQPPRRQMMVIGEPDSRADFIATMKDRAPAEHRFELAILR